ncbi:hypothetical protein GCM10008025_19520 [Ornithinibacillus halotolerans]|uniref:Uncharacterized protein n=1 Tax=Ornithinibacillus halotolerans TaxID=1274357 RepID=A0A916RXM5_9BACI|nr:hypothetical protein GCM10008025_19520 [Ornithinibacillus halotolerans]
MLLNVLIYRVNFIIFKLVEPINLILNVRSYLIVVECNKRSIESYGESTQIWSIIPLTNKYRTP